MVEVDMGVAHGDDLQYVFSGIWGEEAEMSPSDLKFTRTIFVPLLANFAKTRSVLNFRYFIPIFLVAPPEMFLL